MTKKTIKAGALLAGKLSAEEFASLCRQRSTTQNNYSHVTQQDVINAARQIGKVAGPAFSAWMKKEPGAK